MKPWCLPPDGNQAARGVDLLEEVTLFEEKAPADFGDKDAEYWALREDAALLPAPWERVLELKGPDRRSFLHNLLTQDVASLSPGICRPAALADRKGHLLVDLWILEREDATAIRVRSDRLDVLLETFERHRFREKVQWDRPELEIATFLLLGPRAPDLLPLIGAQYRSGVTEGGGLSEFGSGAIWMRVRETAPAEFLLAVPVDSATELWRRLCTGAGAGAGGGEGGAEPGVYPGASATARPIGWHAFNLRRIEVGQAWFGLDADPDRLVPEAGLDDRISYTKGCFLGQETLSRLHYQGQVNWRIGTLRLEAADLPAPGESLLSSDQRVGWVTSAARHPDGFILALAYLHRRFREGGGDLVLASGARALRTQPGGVDGAEGPQREESHRSGGPQDTA